MPWTVRAAEAANTCFVTFLLCWSAKSRRVLSKRLIVQNHATINVWHMSSIGHENGLSVEEIRAIQQRVGRPHDVDHNQENPQTVLADATIDALLLRRTWDAGGAE